MRLGTWDKSILGGSWDLVSKVRSTLIRVIIKYIVTSFIILTTKSHDPLSCMLRKHSLTFPHVRMFHMSLPCISNELSRSQYVVPCSPTAAHQDAVRGRGDGHACGGLE